MRRFEFVEGRSKKFWEVGIAGASVTSRWGRIGTDGQSLTKKFPKAGAAKDEQERLIAEKLRKGYREVTAAGADRPATTSSKPARQLPARGRAKSAALVTTPPRPIEIAAIFPELAELRRQAVRLHPVPGDPALASSHVGGSVLWPADEPWPTSDEKQYPLSSFDADTMKLKQVRKPNRSFVAILQLRREDVPELPFPEDKDIFQLLWNPRAHPGQAYAPLVQVFWRREASIGEPRAEAPLPEAPDESLVPKSCVLHPEPVFEYPCPLALPKALRKRIGDWDDVPEGEEDRARYQYQLSVAPGLKVGGHPYFHISDPVQPRCSRKHEMELLVTVDPSEWDGGAGETWRAKLKGKRLRDDNPTGMRVGRDGSLLVFVCRKCPSWPTSTVMQ